MKSRPWGRKTPPASTHRPHSLPHPPRPRLHFRAHVCTSLPAFTLPPHSLPRPPQSNRPPAAAVIHNGLSTEKLSTLLPAALCKTCSPSRLRTRIYNISFARSPLPGSVRVAPEKSPRRCATVSRAAVRRVGEGEGKGRRPLAQCRTMPLVCRITVRKGGSAPGQPRPCPCILPAAACLPPRPRPLMGEAPSAGWGRAKAKAEPPCTATRPCLPTAPPPPPKWAPRLRRREGKRPNGAPPHHNTHTPNAARKRYLHNSRTKTQRRTKRCAQFVFFVFTPCKLLHNFSTVLHRSPREVPKRAQIAARRPDFPCFTARFSPFPPESHCAKHPRTAPVLPPKNAPLRAYAKPRPHPRVRGTRQHATTFAFFTFSARYGRIGGPPKTNFCPAEGRKWGRFRSQMLKNGLQTKKSTFSFGRLVI